MSQLADRYHAVQERIDAAAGLAGRNRDDLTVVVVTKNHPASLVLDLIELGARDFGENRDQEASAKGQAVAAALGETAGELRNHWHFVGQLQSNKVRSVLQYAATIHSLDRASLLAALAKETAKVSEEHLPPIGVFIELNLTDDLGRGGIVPAELERFATAVLEVPGLNLLGVMGVATLEQQAERDFALIRSCSERLQAVAPAARFISAGMSGDFEQAIGFGATHLRIGTAITGHRQY